MRVLPADALDCDPRRTLRLSPTNSAVAEYVTLPQGPATTAWSPDSTIGGPLKKDKVWFFWSVTTRRLPAPRADGQLQPHGVSRTKKGRLHGPVRNRQPHGAARPTTSGARRGPRPSATAGFEGQASRALAGNSNPTANYDVNTIYPNYSGRAELRLHAVEQAGPEPPGAATTGEQRLHRGHLRRHPVPVHQLPNVNQGRRRPGPVPADDWLHEHTDQHRNHPGHPEAHVGAVRRHLLLLGRWRAPDQGGVQADRIGNDVLRGETGNLVRLYWENAVPGQPWHLRLLPRALQRRCSRNKGFITQGNISSNNIGLFLQDSWTINGRFTLNLGLRTENEAVPAYTSGPDVLKNPIKFSFADKIAPRLGFAWDVKGNGKTKVYGSWGMFYDIMKLELPRGSWGGDKWLEYYYTLDSPGLGHARRLAGCPPAWPGPSLLGPHRLPSPLGLPG